MSSQSRKEGGGVDGTAIGIKIGIEVIKKTTPKGFAWLTTYIGGKEILILGPGKAGKTSFVDYLQFGILEHESEHHKTHHVDLTPTFELSMGQEGALKLKVRRAVDTPGQIGPVAHAELVKERKPHAILLMLDLTKAQSTSIAWIKEFSEHLDTVCRDNKKIIKKIRTIIVILNKFDKCKADTYQKYRSSIKKGITLNIKEVIGPEKCGKIPILPCVAVENKDGSKHIDAIIRKLAKELI